MVKLTINGQQVSVPEGMTIMEAAEKVGVHIPHLCYLKDINEIGACRVCLVELKGMEKLVTACNTICEEGMEILTNSPRVRRTRRINVELILSDHNTNCASCIKSGNCTLQTIANDVGIIVSDYQNTAEMGRWDRNLPLVRDASKCVKCMRCIQVCEKVQGMGVWTLIGSGYRTTIGLKDNQPFSESDCALCGQCITHCPVGALRERDDRLDLNDALADPEIVTIVQVAPAVRTAWGEQIGLKDKDATMGKLVCALKKIGIDYVFDTNYSADLTIMEEGSEFLERLANRNRHKWPMFTSCCPGWLRFVRMQYPDMVEDLSTAKSPQQMFGAISKTYIAQKLGLDPAKIFSVSIMPCVAKKFECDVEQVNDAGRGKDVDLVLTTRELDRLIRCDSIKPQDLMDVPFDDIFGEGSGAAVIFGTTGGVMEAALRSAYYLVTGSNPDPDAFSAIRGVKGWKEATFTIPKVGDLSVAVVSGLSNARQLMTDLEEGRVHYDFVEVMACPGGCAGGGGQPIHDGTEMAEARGNVLWNIDKKSPVRFSHENPEIQTLYREYLRAPLSGRSHHLLHTDHEGWKMPNQK